MKKQYKALMLDLDGTTVPNAIKGLPSTKVIKAIAEASKKIHVGFVTGRPYEYTKNIRSVLSINGPSIASGGAQIVNVATNKILWEKAITENDFEQILPKLRKYSYKVLIQEKGLDRIIKPSDTIFPKDILSIAIMDIEPEAIETVIDDLKEIPSIAVHKIIGWKKDTYWVQISHADATKQYGILEVAKLLKVQTHEIIGVGDSYNDFPLLMACGLKIAMGNAVPELKAIADYIAPTVDEDGVADVIEKFIL
jgi:HAD superfamily hydrolase (TIGR01484 family)